MYFYMPGEESELCAQTLQLISSPVETSNHYFVHVSYSAGQGNGNMTLALCRLDIFMFLSVLRRYKTRHTQ